MAVPVEVFLLFVLLAYFYGRHSGVKAFKKKHRDMWQ